MLPMTHAWTRVFGIKLVPIVLVFVFGVLCLGFLVVSPEIIKHRKAVSLPPALADALFLSSNGKVYKSNGVFFASQRNDARVADFAREGEHIAYLMVTAPPYGMTVDVDGVVLESSGFKRDIALSPDGTKVAYAEAVEIQGDSISYSRALPGAWSVVVVDVLSKQKTVIGSGFSPLFTDNQRMLWFSDDGVFSINLETGEKQTVLSVPFTDVRYPIAQSPDGTLISWFDTLAGRIRVFKIVSLDPVLLSPVTSFTSSSALFSLGDDAFYIFETDVKFVEGTRIARATPQRPDFSLFHTLPAGFGIILKIEL
jgi:hypothetical protein